MPTRIALCDDDPGARKLVRDYLEHWAAAREVTFALDEYPSAEAYLFANPAPASHDILLLDIEMGEMDGVSLARKLRADDDALQIVFITGYSDYIAEGYEVSALHYLVKPLNADKFTETLDRAHARIRKNERMIALETPDGLVRLPLGSVRWLEVSHNYVTVHARADHTVKRTLRELEELLDGRFYRVGRSVIVNLANVARVSRTEILLTDGARIPLPRGAYDAINHAIMKLDQEAL